MRGSTCRAIVTELFVSISRRCDEVLQHTKSWLYSLLKRARRFSGLFAPALLPDGEAREVPAIKRDHYRHCQLRWDPMSNIWFLQSPWLCRSHLPRRRITKLNPEDAIGFAKTGVSIKLQHGPVLKSTLTSSWRSLFHLHFLSSSKRNIIYQHDSPAI